MDGLGLPRRKHQLMSTVSTLVTVAVMIARHKPIKTHVMWLQCCNLYKIALKR